MMLTFSAPQNRLLCKVGGAIWGSGHGYILICFTFSAMATLHWHDLINY